MTLLAAGWPGFSLPARAAQLQQQQVLKGHVPAVTRRLAATSRLDGAARLDLAIGLPLRNREQLTNLLHEIYQPSSTNFRHYLRPEEFAAAFGPRPEDYQAVIDFAQAHNLTVRHTHANRTLLDVSGSVADIENALHLHLHVFQHPREARKFFAPDAEPSLDLATPLLAISGLDSYVRPHPQIHPARPLVHPLGGGQGGTGGGGGSGSGGLFIGYDFQGAYVPATFLDGTGQSVALFELTGYDPDDISDYVSEAGLPGVPLTNVYVDGFTGDDSQIDYAIEATADIEMAISMAPGLSSVLVYEGPTPLYEAPLGSNAIQYASTTAQINDVFNEMAVQNLAAQISCSYQMDINLSTVQIFEQFAAQGQTFLQGSGDFGAYASAVDQPSDDPYVTVVGGTTLTTDSDGNWVAETVWLTPATSDPLLGDTPEQASGGGFSLTYPIPTWQQGISMTDNQGSTTMRNLPDVALVADNVDVVWGNDFFGTGNSGGGNAIDLPEAGTSVATPLWAGFVALVNQQAAANGQPRVGFINPALYAIGKSANYAACFHDITDGNNFSPSSPARYSATTGYDLCTGWGTINDPLIDALLAPPTENLLITPPAGFTSQGPGGGPFSESSETYTLKNTGPQPLNWSLANPANWLTVSKTSGTLNPGATTTVTVSLNSTASNALIATFHGNISFADLAYGTFQNRQFDLYVGNGGFETGDFTNWNFVGSTNHTFPIAADDVDVGGISPLGNTPDALFVHAGLYGAYLGQSPPDASLSQSVATTAGHKYVVSFWLTSVSYQGKTTPNDFTARWNGSVLYGRTNLAAFGWTNLQYVVPATGSHTTIEFDFNNVPAAFALDDVLVEAVPPPVLQPVVMTPGAITLAWSSFSNLTYQVQATTNLGGTNWANVGSPITASNNTVTVSEPVGSTPRQFYRVVLLPSP
jgi:hypothetical protein